MSYAANAKAQNQRNTSRSRSKGPLSINSPHQLAPPGVNNSNLSPNGNLPTHQTMLHALHSQSSSPLDNSLKELLLGALGNEILKNDPNGTSFPRFLETDFLRSALSNTVSSDQAEESVRNNNQVQPTPPPQSSESQDSCSLKGPGSGSIVGLSSWTSSATLDDMRGKLLQSLHVTTTKLLEQEAKINSNGNMSVESVETIPDALITHTPTANESCQEDEAAKIVPIATISPAYSGSATDFADDSTPSTENAQSKEPSSLEDHSITDEKILPLSPMKANSQAVLADCVANLEAGSTESFGAFIEKMKLSEETLTRLVIHQFATNALLKLVGKEAKNLKILDVKGSQAVTNEGIKALFLSPRPEHASLAMSWIHKYGNCANAVTSTLEYLDVTYTSVNYTSRRFINFLPGSYSFPRNFYTGDSFGAGHNIFCRNMPDLGFIIKTPGNNKELEAQLGVITGARGASSFKRLIERHPSWKNYLVSVRNPDKNRRIPKKLKEPVNIIVTPTMDDKRIYGQVLFESGDISGLYSSFPIHVNTILETCPKIQNLNCQLHGLSQSPKSILPMLTALNTVADVATFHSFLPQCPNLRYAKFRISEGILQDAEFMQTIDNSTCSTLLRELWILPAFSHINEALSRSKSLQRKPSKQISHSQLAQREGLKQRPLIEINSDQLTGSACKAHCMLSIDSLHHLIYTCPHLTFIGNLMFWEKLRTEDYDKLVLELGSIKTGQILERNSVYAWDLDLSTHWNL